jgi:hypothetical protein
MFLFCWEPLGLGFEVKRPDTQIQIDFAVRYLNALFSEISILFPSRHFVLLEERYLEGPYYTHTWRKVAVGYAVMM